MARVYLINLHEVLPGTRHQEFSNKEWMEISEKQGNIYSLSGFQSTYNTNGLDSIFSHSVIRFI